MKLQNRIDYYKIAFLIVSAFLLQIYFIPVIEINIWRPDLILIIIIFIGYKYGTITATITGFILGVFQDSLSVSPVGISSFANCIVGFLAGAMREYKMKSNISYLLTIIFLLLHGFLFYMIYQIRSEATYTYFVFTRIFPNTIYTFIIWIIFSYFFESLLEEST